MSLYGEAIINRLPLHSVLHDKDNPMRKIIDYGPGEYLSRYDVDLWFKQHFLQEATGDYLDLHGRQYGVKRHKDENDESYRERITYTVIGHLTTNYLNTTYNVELYTRVSPYVHGKTLISDNPYLIDSSEVIGYFGVANDDAQKIIDEKYVIDKKGGIVWL